MSINLDLHVHTRINGKTLITAEQLSEGMKRNGMHGAAVTNFHDLTHAIAIKEKLQDKIIIVGQEIISKDGHIIGLGLNKRVADLQSAEDTVGSIHRQAGIAVAPHPFAPLGLGKKAMALPFDAIEVYNSMIGKAVIFNYLARNQVSKTRITPLASTDASDYRYIGWSHTEILTDVPRDIFNTILAGGVRLKRRPLPLPIIHLFKLVLGFSNVEPCSLHSSFCYLCGKSLIFKIVRKKYSCFDCGKESLSHIVCCNGHYLCMDCILKRNKELEA